MFIVILHYKEGCSSGGVYYRHEQPFYLFRIPHIVIYFVAIELLVQLFFILPIGFRILESLLYFLLYAPYWQLHVSWHDPDCKRRAQSER